MTTEYALQYLLVLAAVVFGGWWIGVLVALISDTVANWILVAAGRLSGAFRWGRR